MDRILPRHLVTVNLGCSSVVVCREGSAFETTTRHCDANGDERAQLWFQEIHNEWHSRDQDVEEAQVKDTDLPPFTTSHECQASRSHLRCLPERLKAASFILPGQSLSTKAFGFRNPECTPETAPPQKRCPNCSTARQGLLPADPSISAIGMRREAEFIIVMSQALSSVLTAQDAVNVARAALHNSGIVEDSQREAQLQNCIQAAHRGVIKGRSLAPDRAPSMAAQVILLKFAHDKGWTLGTQHRTVFELEAKL